MPKSVNVGGTWRNVVQAFVKVGTTGGPFNNGWRTIQQGFVRVAGAWRQFFAGAITAGTVTIARSSTTHPSNLTGSTTYWDGVTTLTAVFQKSSAQNGAYTDIGTPSAIDNPVDVPGQVTTREYITTAAEFTYETPTLWYRWSVTGSDGTNTLTQNSTPVSVAFPTPIGQAGSVTFSRNSNDSYVYSVISPGNWSGSPTTYRYQWQYLSGSTWINITGATSSTFDANASYTNLADPKLDTIRPVVWASNAAGESATFIAPTAGLFVHYRKPGITAFNVTGGTGFVSYSYTEATHNIDPSRTVTISYTGPQNSSFNPSSTSGTFSGSGSLPGGTYTFTITVTNSVTNGAGLVSDAVTVNNVVVSGLTAGSISVSPSSGQASGSNRVTIGANLTVSIGSGWSSGLTYTYQWRHSRDQAGVGPVIISTTTTATVPTTYVATNTFFTIGEWIEVRVTGTNAGGQSVNTTLQSFIVPPTPTFSLTDNQNSTFTISGVSSNRATYYRGSYSGSGTGTINQTAIATNTTVNSGAGTFNVSLIAGATDFNSIARESFTAGTGSVTVSSLITPTITFNNQSATFTQGGTYSLSYTTNSPGTVSFSSSDTSVVTVTGSTLNFITPNTVNTPARTSTITLTQAAGGGYAAATRTMTFTLNPGTALVPTFSTPNRSATGWTSSVIDYSNLSEPWINWNRQTNFSSSPTTPSPTTTWNDADGLISVSGMASGQVTTFTLTLTRFGYQTGTASVSASRCDAPTNTAQPTLSGTFTNNGTVTSTTGTWSGASTYQYRFQLRLGSATWENQTLFTSTSSYTIPAGATTFGYQAVRSQVRAVSSCGTVSGEVSSPEYLIGAGTPPPTTPPTTTPPTTTPPRTPPTLPPTVPPTTPPRTPPTLPPTTPPRTPPTTPPRTPPTSPPTTPPRTPPPRTPPRTPPPTIPPL